MCDKIVEKAIDVEVKANLQPPFGTKEIDSRCPKKCRPLVKKNKDNTYWKHHDETSNKNKDKAKS